MTWRSQNFIIWFFLFLNSEIALIRFLHLTYFVWKLYIFELNLVLAVENGCSCCLTLCIVSLIRRIYLEIVRNWFRQAWTILILAKLQIDWIIYMMMIESWFSFWRMECLLLSFFHHFHKMPTTSFQRFLCCYRTSLIKWKIWLLLDCRYTLRKLCPVFIWVVLLII
jgi:hypothetical protein